MLALPWSTEKRLCGVLWQPNPSQSLLDIGCGPGQFACFLRDQGIRRYLGIDFSEETVRLARQACPEMEFRQADVFSTDVIHEGIYDVVVCMEFLEHVDRDVEVLGMIRPGTRVLGTVPSFSDPGHVRLFTSSEEVSSRYSALLTDWRCDAFRSAPDSHPFFLFDGVRI